MNKQKLISVLQSRIAKRRSSINNFWEAYYQDNTQGLNLDTFKKVAINTGKVQKEDKAILKQLVEDERSIKEWKARFWKTLGMYCKEGV